MNFPFDHKKRKFGLPPLRAVTKRFFDIILALLLSVALFWVVLILAIIARLDTGKSGIFRQERIGLYGEPFTVFKLRTMREIEDISSTVTTRKDKRVTRFGGFMRKWKLDEFPQLFNILNGTMSFVGPRPDVKSTYMDLDDEQLRILSVRPGITGPASIRFRDEEVILAETDNPERYSQQVIFPEKVRLNLEYIENYSLKRDILLIFQTVFSGGRCA